MERVVVYLGLSDQIFHHADDDLIGVDRGALFLAQQNIHFELAYGDFDSVNEEELSTIKMYCKKIIKVSAEKNSTDSEGVLDYCHQYQEILLVGGLGGRKDHELVNVGLCIRDQRIKLVNKTNLIYKCSMGQYKLYKNGYKYLSFIPLAKSKITIMDVLYPLLEREVTSDDLYLTSNEIVDSEATLVVHKGSFLVVQSNDV